MGVPPHPTYPPTLGARYLGEGRCRFRVWAPRAQHLELKLFTPDERTKQMLPVDDHGSFELTLEDVPPGTRYCFRLDEERDRPDPASRFQPDGVHNTSAVVDSSFDWTDQHWPGLPLHRYINYELHVGTYTPAGTFDAIVPLLDDLVDLGVTALELMPVAQFPGGRNWGYDGVHLFAPQNTYGGPDGLKRLVNAAHNRGLAVVLDVVYNHLGPEGNYLGEFGPYFTERHRTPWGEAVNFEGPGSDEVRRFFIENALYWIDEFHIDALRLDAVHAIFDYTAMPFLQELADAVRVEGERLNRRVYTIAESSLSDPRIIRPKELGGYGIDAQWCDDLHHALHAALTGECVGCYVDYGGIGDIVTGYREGFVRDGKWSTYRGRRHGSSARDVAPAKLVVCTQNHDQVGNRLGGERLAELISFEQLKLAAGVVLLSPYQPLLFMGEEYAETARFHYFVSHGDPELVEAVRQGRMQEFARFHWEDEPLDPQDEKTYEICKLNHQLKHEGRHRILREFYKSLIDLRSSESALSFADRSRMRVELLQPGHTMSVHRWSAGRDVFVIFHFGESPETVRTELAAGTWIKRVNSADEVWRGSGDMLPERIESSGDTTLTLAAHSVSVFIKSR